MRVLITSGGTKVSIDPVRDITNMSRGTFGSAVAREFLERGDEVIFLCAEGSRSPFKLEFDYHRHGGNYDSYEEELTRWYEFVQRHDTRFHPFAYRNYGDYFETLRRLMTERRPDAVVLAAAVSDYLVKNPAVGKIRSADALTIDLEPAAKVIGRVKEWHPKTFLVGFKLLVNATEAELKAASAKSIRENGCDLVVANDLSSLKAGDHKVTLYAPANGGAVVRVTPAEDDSGMPFCGSPAVEVVTTIKEMAR
jgi:phosphopantothenoylcysteine synthetase/decarboxylase